MSDNNVNNKLPRRKPVDGRVDFGFIFFLVMLAITGIFYFLNNKLTSLPEIPYSSFLLAVEGNQVLEIEITNDYLIEGVLVSPETGEHNFFKTVIPYNDSQLMPLLENHGVKVSGLKKGPSFFDVLLESLPLLLIMMLVFSLMMRQNAAANAKGMQFGKSRARLYNGGKKVTFADVAGQEEAKSELADIIDFLKNPKKYTAIGAKIPTGVLLVGNPGTGKTLLARAVAGEAGVSFLHISGSDFVEMFVGVGASRVRDLFEQGRRMAPAIIFIDEIDAVGRSRGAGLGGGHDEREQTLNQMLVEMDGFENKDGIIVLAATNRPDVLDPALLRPGRFDRQVTVALPDIKEREAILKVHSTKVPVAENVDFGRIARATPGMSGAELSNLVNEAALFAAGKNQENVTEADFELARDKLLMGVARESMVISEKEKKMIAYHEAGHALPYYYLDNASPLHKVSVIPRGRALGVTVGIPEEDSYYHTRSWLEDQLVILFGGYAAETLVYQDPTTGTQNDLHRATELARRMVCQWGMSEEVGAVSYHQEDEPVFMGRDLVRHKTNSEETARKIDAAVETVLSQARQRCSHILSQHRDQLDTLAQALIEQETLDDEEIRQLLGFPSRNSGAESTLVPTI